MPRRTDDPKSAVVKLRLGEDLKAALEHEAAVMSMNLSEYIRKVLKERRQVPKIPAKVKKAWTAGRGMDRG